MKSCVYSFFFFKQKTAYVMRISDWSSDVCSSDLAKRSNPERFTRALDCFASLAMTMAVYSNPKWLGKERYNLDTPTNPALNPRRTAPPTARRSDEHTSELQSLMRISSAVFCLKKNTHILNTT